METFSLDFLLICLLFVVDEFSMIVFHVCSLMPTNENDENCTNKVRNVNCCTKHHVAH
jgi:hypothetical protein